MKSQAWKDRFRTPLFYQPQVASLNPAHGILISNHRSDAFQVYRWQIDAKSLSALTNRHDGQNEAWISPDGKYVYYLQDHKGNEHGHLMRMSWDGTGLQDLTADLADFTLRGFGLNGDGSFLAFMAVNADGYQLYGITFDPQGTPSVPRLIFQSAWETWEACLSADGRYVAVQSTEKAKGLRRYSTRVYETQTGQMVSELWDGELNSVVPVAFAPSTNELCLLGATSRSGTSRPFLWNPISGKRDDFADLDHLIGELVPLNWSADGEKILLLHFSQAIEQLYVLDCRLRHLQKLDHPQGSVGGLWARALKFDAQEIWIQHESSVHPPRIIALQTATGKLQSEVLRLGPDRPGAVFRSVQFLSSDGQSVQGWLGVPDGKGPFPTILEMHGGPHIVRTDFFDAMAQAWVDQGFAYLSLNYRGSTSFGRDFQQKIWGRIGEWELEDMVAARAWMIDQGIAKSDQVFLHGASYGGFLTLWGLGRRPELWAGGVAMVPGTDWLLSYQFSSEALKGAMRAWFLGSPEDKREAYIQSSPITFADAVKSPVLIFQGRHDTRVPPEEVEAYEQKMQQLGKEIEVIWFDAGHGVLSREQNIEFAEKMMGFTQRLILERSHD